MLMAGGGGENLKEGVDRHRILDQRVGIIWRHTVTELIPLLRRLAVVVRFAARLGAAEDVAHEPRVEVESKISQEGLI